MVQDISLSQTSVKERAVCTICVIGGATMSLSSFVQDNFNEMEMKPDKIEKSHLITNKNLDLSLYDFESFIRTTLVLPPNKLNKDVHELLTQHMDIECAVVCHDDLIPLGLVMKGRFFTNLSNLYGISVFYNKTIELFLDKQSLLVEKKLPIQEVIDQALNRETEFLYDCIIVTDNHKLAGVLTIGDILHIAQILQKSSRETQIQTILQSKQMISQIQNAIYRVMDSIQSGAIISDNMSKITSEGKQEIQKILQYFDQLEAISKNQEVQILDLQNQAATVKDILRMIRKLAEQSNLLSLNATIEAAQAGMQGKGFVVIANEIRNLSAQTEQNAQQVDQIIKHMENSVTQTVSLFQSGRELTNKSTAYVNQTSQVFQNLFDTVNDNQQNMKQLEKDIQFAGIESSRVMNNINLLAGMEDI
jgi:methyl-accepting chemotaxis protein